MTQIKNWKKKNTFNHILLSIEELELKTFEVKSGITYKITVPLNMFEKYAIRLIQRSEEIHYSSINMDITQIGKLLHLDERLVKENLDNLSAIGMLNGVQSDMITINSDENAEYLRYENKFKKEHMTEVFHLTKSEHEDLEIYLQGIFEKNNENRDKKFDSVEILEEKESVKNVQLLNYSDNKFLIYSNDGINSQNDLKFLDERTLGNSTNSQNVPSNVLCHYDEFLPFLKDELQKNRDNLVIIGSKSIDKNNLSILPKKNMEDVYILSDSNETHERIFHVYNDDFLWIGDDFYQRNGEYVILNNDKKIKKTIREKLKDYFLQEIKNIYPEYDNLALEKIDKEIKNIESKIGKILTKKELDLEIQKINTAKNKLYGIDTKSARKRNEIRKKIDKFEEDKNNEALKNYPIYLKNRDKILAYESEVSELKKNAQKRDEDMKKINVLKNKRSVLLPKDVKENIAPFEKELKNIERLKYE